MKPPEKIPESLLNAYSMGNKVSIGHLYFDNSSSSDSDSMYLKETVDEYVKQVSGKSTFYYGATDSWLYSALEKHPIAGHDIVIFGSTIPIYESISISYGCKKCHVIEYGDRSTSHDLIKFYKPDCKEIFDSFDFGMSISSFEHDGLGRYGDPLNPNGDIEAMMNAKKIIKKNGLLFFSAPIGVDKVVWNAHRIYGEKRLELMFNGWEVIDSYGYDEKRLDIDTDLDGGYQPVFVLRNI